MTDLEAMQQMTAKAEIQFIREFDCAPDEIVYLVEDGYPGFYNKFTFNLDGSLKSIEAYE